MSESFLSAYLRKLKASGIECKIPNISEENAGFIKSLIRERKPRHILEIGTANGYSALQFASVLLEPAYQLTGLSASITTIEYAANAHTEAIEHFSNCKMRNIHAIYGDAKAVIPKLADHFFDFLYIDGMKREYLDYLILSLPKLTSDALIVIDDVEKFRGKMENLYRYLDENKIRYTLEKTDVDDSIMLISNSDI
jgi:predicted O-methyltransferase YrrM